MNGRTVGCTKENIRRIRNMVLESTFTLMGAGLKDNGKTVNKMELGT